MTILSLIREFNIHLKNFSIKGCKTKEEISNPDNVAEAFKEFCISELAFNSRFFQHFYIIKDWTHNFKILASDGVVEIEIEIFIQDKISLFETINKENASILSLLNYSFK